MSLRTGAAQLAGRDKAYRQATEDDARSFSAEVSSAAAWSPDFITTLGLPGELAAQAFDPVQSLLCVATKSGSLHLFGAGPVKLEWAPRPSYAVKFLAFKPGSAFLFVIGKSFPHSRSCAADCVCMCWMHRCEKYTDRI